MLVNLFVGDFRFNLSTINIHFFCLDLHCYEEKEFENLRKGKLCS